MAGFIKGLEEILDEKREEQMAARELAIQQASRIFIYVKSEYPNRNTTKTLFTGARSYHAIQVAQSQITHTRGFMGGVIWYELEDKNNNLTREYRK